MAILQKIPHVEDKTIVDIQVSGAFLRMIQMTLLSMGNEKKPEEIMKILDNYKNMKPAESLFEAQFHILTALLSTIEKSAMEQNKVVYQDIDTDKITEN